MLPECSKFVTSCKTKRSANISASRAGTFEDVARKMYVNTSESTAPTCYGQWQAMAACAREERNPRSPRRRRRRHRAAIKQDEPPCKKRIAIKINQIVTTFMCVHCVGNQTTKQNTWSTANNKLNLRENLFRVRIMPTYYAHWVRRFLFDAFVSRVCAKNDTVIIHVLHNLKRMPKPNLRCALTKHIKNAQKWIKLVCAHAYLMTVCKGRWILALHSYYIQQFNIEFHVVRVSRTNDANALNTNISYANCMHVWILHCIFIWLLCKWIYMKQNK